MKARLYILTSLALVSALASGEAGLAQSGHGPGGDRDRPPHNGGPSQRPNPGPGANRPPAQTLPQPVRPPQASRPPQRPGGPQRPPQGGRPPAPRPPVYHRPGAGRPPSFRPLPGPAFHYPNGYRYRRWGIGALLPMLFLSSTYVYSDWRLMGLEPPPPGYYWVRYGPDLLLVERRTRRVADVIYGAFR
jgi:Ni/Co efflux regulator RcnB